MSSWDIPTKWNGSCEEAGEDFNSSLCNKKLIIGARYFNEGLKRAKQGIFHINDTARDSNGHGTFISSVAVGNYVNGASYFGYAKGIAPQGRLAVYKVFWDGGLVDQSDIIASVDQAVADGVDVICMAISNKEVQMYDNHVAIASFAAMEKGVPVVSSADDTGPNFGTIRNGFHWVLAVESGTTDRWLSGVLTLGNQISTTGWSLYRAVNTSILLNLPLVYDRKISFCSPSSIQKPIYGIIICRKGNFGTQMDMITSSNVTGATLGLIVPVL